MTTATQQFSQDRAVEPMPSGLEWHKGETNKLLLREAWKRAGLNPRYPLDTRTVFGILKLMGYAADRQRLDYHLARGYLESPPKQNGEFRWRESDIINFADSLETTRNWVPMHPSHTHKLTADEKLKHMQAAASIHSLVLQFRQMNVNDLLSLMVETQPQENRTMLATVIREKLDVIRTGNEHVPDDSSQTN